MNEFQSTHPLRGATDTSEGYMLIDLISIHAPLAGCDREVVKYLATIDALFQSTHPLRGATNGGGSSTMTRDISIHAPLAGCDPSWRKNRS